MSFTYFKFLFINTVKKKSIWITWVLFLFTCTSFLIILPIFAEMNTLQVWANTTMAVCQTFMGMVAGLYTAVLAINIFKDTNEEGTELIVISKPISRFKLVMSKFILFGCYCLMINLTAVAISAFTYFLPKTEKEFYVGLLVSMFIGNLITFGVFGSISILLTVKFAKVGIIVTNILISLVFLIFQALTLFVFPTPLKELDNQYMSTSTYIIHERDTKTGEYKEDEVVQFNPSVAEHQDQHPCQATNWREMVDYWENGVLSKDPTPVLNVTDLASQLALTYMSYNTDAFAQRQSNRMFAWSRFYNYDLTSPASPEIIDDTIEDRKELNWIYSDWDQYDFEIPGPTPLHPTLFLVSNIGFDGIPPLTGTRLRGYTNTIPVGSVRSKDQLFSNEVYFEKEQWEKYAIPFDLMYDIVYDWLNYDTFYQPHTSHEISPDDYPSAFMLDSRALTHYYEVVWSCLMGKLDDIHCEDQQKVEQMKQYGPTYFDIHSVYDLNERFIQFKNFAYWQALEEQQKAINGDYVGTEEAEGRWVVYNDPEWIRPYHVVPYEDLCDIGGFDVTTTGPYLMIDRYDEEDAGLLVNHSQAPAFDYMWKAWGYALEQATSDAERIRIGKNCSFAHFKKALRVFKTTVSTDEDYLFNSLTKPERQWKYSGRAFSVESTWYPNVNGILKELLELEGNIPVGQNQQFFFYNTTPKLKYWVFGVIWGTISVTLFASGVIVYNKYDVK